ncbi:MAG: MHYT domain-containing protein [Halothece sp. Uz-M2-17]|nr:MHYT domain-containing protein [Halothece sp. Uz-M2-17]
MTDVLVESYNPYLVLLSIFLAIFASYVTLKIAKDILGATNADHKFLILQGAITMGIGIWSMHFIGMLALSLPVEIGYAPLWTLVSIFPAIGASAIALYLITLPQVNQLILFSSAVVMGSGIAIMHYLGMAAMQVQATIRYQPFLLILSVAIAIIVSAIAIKIFSWIREKVLKPKMTIYMVTATVMGFGISAMHYTGMAATLFKASSNQTVDIISGSNVVIGASIIVANLMILISLLFFQD